MTTSPMYDRIMDNVRTHVPGAIDTMIKIELFNALDEFLKGSSVWQEDVEFELEPGETEYPITPDTTNAAVIERLVIVKTANTDTQIHMTMDEPGVLNLTTEVSAEQDVIATVVLTVGEPLDNEDFPIVPEWILTKYYQTIIDGVLWKLMVQPAKPYTNERMSILHMRKFQSGTSQAKVAAARQNLHAAQRWQFPRFA